MHRFSFADGGGGQYAVITSFEPSHPKHQATQAQQPFRSIMEAILYFSNELKLISDPSLKMGGVAAGMWKVKLIDYGPGREYDPPKLLREVAFNY